MKTFQIGDRVTVRRELPGVCSYLWGCSGTIAEIKPPERCIFTGPYVVAFDEPHPKPTEHWPPLKTCAFEAAHLR